ncbi:hypothetical protein AAC03nite_09810 [Alicyclobacillus acidoterrestris]|nr:hypothetical protein AAC03nite_09810 [Alicyclobacillus acidoterrestris]
MKPTVGWRATASLIFFVPLMLCDGDSFSVIGGAATGATYLLGTEAGWA